MQETVIKGGVTCVDQGIMVVTKGQRAVEVEDHVAVGVLEEVALRLLQVDEAESLVNGETDIVKFRCKS